MYTLNNIPVQSLPFCSWEMWLTFGLSCSVISAMNLHNLIYNDIYNDIAKDNDVYDGIVSLVRIWDIAYNED